MNIENKKTALDDDSAIYQKRDDSLGKKDTSSMNTVQKLGYFKDYYLKSVIVCLIILAILASLIYNMFFRHQVTVLSAAFVDNARILDTAALSSDLYQYYGLTRKDDFVDISNYDSNDYASQMKFTTLAASQSIDVFVFSEDEFRRYAGMDYFANLKKLLPADVYAQWKDKIVTASVVETDDDDVVIDTHPAEPFGINISGSALYERYGGTGEDAILAVFANTEHTENIIRFLDYVQNPSVEAAPEESPQT